MSGGLAHAHMVAPQDKVDVATIGPDRKLFETSLCNNSMQYSALLNASARSER